jgi:hypothetical protein
MNAVIVITHLWNTDFAHWWNLYFFPPGKPWYEGLVWGNVFAVLPLAILGTITYWVHKWITKDIQKFDHEASHAELHRKLSLILDQLDPEAESNSTLDLIADRVNEETPGGLGTIRADLRKLAPGAFTDEKSA